MKVNRLYGAAVTLLMLANSAAFAEESSCCKKSVSKAKAECTSEKKAEDLSYKKTFQEYETPGWVLRDQNGEEMTLAEVLDSEKPVFLNFIFTTCTTICPVMSASFSQVYKELGESGEGVRSVSISIDPDHDTPKVLDRYAKRIHASQNQIFLTAPLETVQNIRKNFKTFTSDKFDHEPITLIKLPGSNRWLRLEGLASGKELAAEYRKLSSMKGEENEIEEVD